MKKYEQKFIQFYKNELTHQKLQFNAWYTKSNQQGTYIQLTQLKTHWFPIFVKTKEKIEFCLKSRFKNMKYETTTDPERYV